MSVIEKFEDLDLWKKSRELCKLVFVFVNKDQFTKDFKLKDQIKGASGSIMDNIAEGFERGGNKEFIQFLSISKGSCGEVKSQLYRSLDNEYITKEEFDLAYKKASEISSGLANFIKYLKQSEFKGSKYK
jgi:four helix bundle protein